MSSLVLSKQYELLKNDLIVAYKNKGMKASGQFEKGLEVVISTTEKGYNAKLWGESYSQQLELGRRAGTFPNIGGIKKWIIDKGVFSEAIQRIGISSLAFLIARKIATQGWKREQYGGIELISEVVTDKRIQSIIDEVGAVEANRVATDLILMINSLEWQ